ncbi:unnamed protein product [Closterium sp. NIES-53]
MKHLIKDIQCGPKAWKILKDVHVPSSEAMVVVLERQLHAVKINEGDAVQGVFDQLRDLYVKLSAAGVDYPEKIKCYKALSLLPESWGPLVVNLNGMKDSWSLEWIRAQVLQEEFRRKELTAAAGEGGGSAYGMKGFKGRGSKKGKAKEGSGGEQYSGGKRSNKGGKRCGGKCWYCHVEGHPWFKCRKLPDGWSSLHHPLSFHQGAQPKGSVMLSVVEPRKEQPRRGPRDFLKYERLGVPKALLVQEEEDEEEKGAEGEQICCFGVNLPHEPASMEEALAGDDREAWLASREDEFQSHMENETWTLTNLPPGMKALDCTWVLRVKTDAEGRLERRKTRLVMHARLRRLPLSSPPLVLYKLGDYRYPSGCDGSSLYTLATEPPQVAASAQVSASGQVAASCSCRLLSHQTLLWHHRLGHPSLPRLRGMHSRLLVSGLPRSLPSLPPSPASPCLPCVEGRQCAAPHSSSFPPKTAPLQTLHMDVWGPARVSGLSRECYFLLVVDDYTRYTTVFPLRIKGQVVDVLIPWIRTVRLQLRERFGQDLPVLRLHSDRGGEFSSNLLRDFCRGEGILQSFPLLDSPQQNGIAERRIGLVMEVARTSMIHAAAPHFLWPFAVQYVAH